MTAAPPRPAVLRRPPTHRTAGPPTHPAVSPPTHPRGRLRYGAALARLRARAAVSPTRSVPRLQVCGAANLLTALGVRVDVVQPATPWPRDRAHRLLVDNQAGPLGDLALLVGVPRTAEGWTDVADRTLPLRQSKAPARRTGDAVVCPVVLTCRYADGTPFGGSPIRDDVGAQRGLVVEVRLLPAREEHRAG